MSSVSTPRSESTRISSSPKSSPTGPTTRTSVKKLAASEKWTAEPPSIRSRSPNGDLTASKAIDPTTHRLMARAGYRSQPAGIAWRGASARAPPEPTPQGRTRVRGLGEGGVHRDEAELGRRCERAQAVEHALEPRRL